MSPDQERWAEALAVEQMYGKDGPRFIVERIDALAVAGDQTGVDRRKAISIRYDQLLVRGQAPPSA